MHSNEATKQWIRRCVGALLGVSFAVTAPLLNGRTPLPPQPNAGRGLEPLGASINFEPNLGQAEERVKFMARGPGYTLSLTQQGVVLSFQQSESRAGSEVFHSLALKFMGASGVTKLAAKDELATTSSYFLGADPTKWRTGIPNFGSVTIENVYPGIDVMYQGTHGRLQCSFLVAAGAQPSRITMAISGAKKPRLDSEGNLIFGSANTELRLHKPTAHQDAGTSKRPVSAKYLVRSGRILFALTDYDGTKALTIDPVLSYERYLRTEDSVRSQNVERHE
jgi:hypothetical protein